VHLVGTAKGVVAGGVVEHHLHAVLVECLPGNIPNRIEVDISNLEIGDSIHVRAVSIPGVKLLDSPDVAIVGVTSPEAEEEAAVVPEAEEPAKVE
jgi:large subunit ribosomal protein L25